MSGISAMEKKKTHRILSDQFPHKPNRFRSWGHEDLDSSIQEKANRLFKDENCPQSSYKLPKVYLQRNGIVYSGIRSIFYDINGFPRSLNNRHGLLIIHGKRITAAVFEGGSMTSPKIYPQPIKPLSQKTESRYVDCSSIIESWMNDSLWADCIFYCCDNQYDDVIESIAENTNVNFHKVSFTARKASLDELSRIWTKTFCVVEHGTSQAFKRALSIKPKMIDSDTENQQQTVSSIPLTKAQRLAEKLRWPGLSARKKNQIHKALLTNDYDQLQQLLELDPETIDYLSVNHDKLGGKSFLQYATKEDLTETVKFLLEAGCDRIVKDGCGRSAYNLAQSDEMKQVYEHFNNETSLEDKWKKCKVGSRSRKPKNNKKQNPIEQIERRRKQHRVKPKYSDELGDFSLKFGSNTSKITLNINQQPSKPGRLSKKTTRTHSLLDKSWYNALTGYPAVPFLTILRECIIEPVSTKEDNDTNMWENIENLMNISLHFWFTVKDVLYSGYSLMVNQCRDKALKQHVVLLIDDQHFAGSVFEMGKVRRKKQLFYRDANWTELKEHRINELCCNRFINVKFENCLSYVLNYWDSTVKVRVLFQCPQKFIWILKERVLQSHKLAEFEFIPFIVDKPCLNEIMIFWREITHVIDYGNINTFNLTENYPILKQLIEKQPAKLQIPCFLAGFKLTRNQIRDLQIAVSKNSYGIIRKLHIRIYPGILEYLYERHAMLNGQTFPHVAARKNLDKVLKFWLERCPPWRRSIKDLSGNRAIDYCTTEKIRILFDRADCTVFPAKDYTNKAHSRTFWFPPRLP